MFLFYITIRLENAINSVLSQIDTAKTNCNISLHYYAAAEIVTIKCVEKYMEDGNNLGQLANVEQFAMNKNFAVKQDYHTTFLHFSIEILLNHWSLYL